jgi:hypothetical protein
MSQPYFERVWRWNSHSWNGDLGVLRDSQNFKVRLQGQNTSHWGVLYIIGSYRNVDVKNELVIIIWTSATQVMVKKRPGVKLARQKVKLQLKFENRLDPSACRWSATHRWKALHKSYEVASDLIPIRGMNKELEPRKVMGVQTGIKTHSNVGAAERCRILYGRRWWLSPNPGHGESCESRVTRGLS